MKLFDYSPSMELMIHEQRDDKDIKKVEELFEDLIHIARKKNFGTAAMFFKNQDAKGIIKDIDKKLSDRFGLNIKHINSEGGGYGGYISTPSIDSAITPHASGMTDILDKFITSCTGEECDGYYKKAENIVDDNKDSESIAYRIKKSIDALDNHLKNNDLTFDLKKAKVNNAPKDTCNFLFVDFHYLVFEERLNAKELVSTTLHEVGHAIANLTHIYRSARTTTVIMETIRDELSNNDNLIEVLQITANKAFNKELKSSNTAAAIVELYDTYSDDVMKISKHDTRESIDSEQLADQFSTRFGYGEYLAKALNNGYDEDRNKFKYNMYVTSSLLYAFLPFVIFFLVYNALFFISAALAYVVYGYITTIYTGGVFSLITGDRYSREGTYDGMKRRLERIRLDMIRQLRNSDLPMDAMKEKINSIEKIDMEITKAIERNKPLEKIGNFMPWNYKNYTYSQMDYLIEKMMENNLHLMKAKLSTLKG